MPNATTTELVDVCWQRIEQTGRRIAEYEQKFGASYETFNQRVSTDQVYLETLNRDHPTWEADAIEWEYRLEGLQT
jgi:ribosomal protein L31